ncbi:phage head-tail adaptor [Moraxella macacae 0408225]|uniref:Phage head-tail adaptor n=1 Tax=Moraxella macacae 0408225 TaxID=1230338 RepID=L2F8E7_9GAMM|nr:phage head closure protein [Moraxella macacae]ELA08738.1 phage head-tail adaptor [Moraxella macacae 0408225]
MKATELRHRLKIYQQTAIRSPTGAVRVTQWEHIRTIYGHFTPLSVKDIIAGQTQQTNITAKAKIRHRTDLIHSMRVQYAGRMYEIVGEPLADNQSGKEYLTLILKGVADDRQY